MRKTRMGIKLSLVKKLQSSFQPRTGCLMFCRLHGDFVLTPFSWCQSDLAWCSVSLCPTGQQNGLAVSIRLQQTGQLFQKGRKTPPLYMQSVAVLVCCGVWKCSPGGYFLLLLPNQQSLLTTWFSWNALLLALLTLYFSDFPLHLLPDSQPPFSPNLLQLKTLEFSRACF